MGGRAIEVRGARKAFAGHVALHGVDLTVASGAVHGLLGPNGAGKTTLIRMLAGITAPDSGDIAFFGEPFRRDHISDIGYLPEERGLYKAMKVGEQALYLARLRGLDRREATERLRFWFDRLHVDGWWNREVSDLSKGMAQKIQFITTILHEPRLLILDEPLSGFDPINAQRIKEVILELREDKGTTVLLSTHDMSSVEELCDEVTMVHQGRVVLDGNVESLRAEASKNRLEVTFGGPALTFTHALGFSADLLGIEEVGEDRRRAAIALKDGVEIPAWIAGMSAEVPLHACTPWRPSMRDLFLDAVTPQEES